MSSITSDKITELLELTLSESVQVCADALRAMCPCHIKKNSPGVWERVLEMVNDPELKVRRQVLHLLSDGSPNSISSSVVQAVETLTHDSDEKLRRHARKLMTHYRQTGKINSSKKFSILT